MAVACVSTVVVNADISAVSILLPSISVDLQASVSTLQWVVTGYLLAGYLLAGYLLAGGRSSSPRERWAAS